VTEVPSDLEPGGKTDYLETKTMYEKFWTECQEYFIWDVDIKYEIPIEQMIWAPTDWTIREYKEQGMINMKHYLVNMPDPFVKQTLCVMPNTNERPTMWDENTNGRLFIINGQHSLAASKDMQTTSLLESIVKNFRKWNCFIV
jgi:hypothetical protein